MGERMKVVLNPTSGGGAGRRLRAELETALSARGLSPDIVVTRGPGHAAELAEAAARAGARAVAAAGGDGTVHEVANGLLRAGTGTALGLIPIGTGNDFVKVVPGTRRRSEAYDTLVSGGVHRFDAAVARWDGGEEFFVNAAGTGIDVEVVRQIASLKGLFPGPIVYIVGLARALLRYRPVRLRVVPDAGGPPITRDVMLVAVANGRCVGGAFHLTPDAVADDGRLDLCLVAAVKPLTALRVAPRVLRGTHLGHPSVSVARDRAFEIIAEGGGALVLQLDGELRQIPGDRVRMEVLPGALPVIAAIDPEAVPLAQVD